jgi:hypothetical protein
MNPALSLTPGFNPVCHDARRQNRFNGFPPAPNKPLKRFSHRTSFVTGLKPGVNEKGFSIPDHFVLFNEMVGIGSGAQRELEDWALSRYACYLVIQNAEGSSEAEM